MANDLNLPAIADSQADGQWQTSNDADAALGNATTDTYSVDFSAGNVTLNSTQYRSAMVFKPSAALAAARTLILPAVKRPFIFHNTDATYTVTLKSTDGASPETALTKAVATGEIFVGYTNGSSPGLYGATVSTTGSSGVSDGDKGDITVSSSGSVWTIDNDTISNAKLANMATQTFKGRTTAGTGDPEDLTVTQATALLNAVVGDSGSGGTKGLVPAPAAGDAAAGKFLKADGTFAVPAGTSITAKDEGSTLTTGMTSIDFVGSGVTATNTGGAVTVTVSGGGGTTKPFIFFRPYDNEPPASNFATLDLRNSRPVLEFDTTTQEAAVFSGVLPVAYAGGGLTVEVYFAADTATTGTIGWDAAIERIDASSLDTDTDSFATAQTITAATVPGTSGQILKSSCTFASGSPSDMDNLAAGEAFRLRIRRDVANDTATGDAQLFYVVLRET